MIFPSPKFALPAGPAADIAGFADLGAQLADVRGKIEDIRPTATQGDPEAPDGLTPPQRLQQFNQSVVDAQALELDFAEDVSTWLTEATADGGWLRDLGKQYEAAGDVEGLAAVKEYATGLFDLRRQLIDSYANTIETFYAQLQEKLLVMP